MKNKANGMARYFKYFIFAEKFIACKKGIGFKSMDFCSILARSNSDGFSACFNCNTFTNLSSTSLKCFPMIFEASIYEIPFCKPNNFTMGITIKLTNKNNSTTIKLKKRTVRNIGFNHKKYSIKSVNRK